MARYPDIELDIALADRLADFVDEGFDLAIRISRGGSPTFTQSSRHSGKSVSWDLSAPPTKRPIHIPHQKTEESYPTRGFSHSQGH